MDTIRLRRGLALITSAALLASLAVTSVAAPAAAAKPKCQGKTATIVGTNKADIIVGTAKRDVIVAKGGADRIFGRGGNDLICAGDGNDRVVGQGGIDKLIGGRGADKLFGGPGSDRLFGGPGPDLAAGQLGNDVIDGGVGVDTCYQNTGSGPVMRCEKPAAPAPAPNPTPAPLPPPKTLAIAYSDLNGDHAFDAGDVLISRLVDANRDGVPSAGDMIEMGRWPVAFDLSTFGDWAVKSHVVTSESSPVPGGVVVVGGMEDHVFTWQDNKADGKEFELYMERAGTIKTQFQDSALAEGIDINLPDPRSPSHPKDPTGFLAGSETDDRFIDVNIDL